MRKFDILVIEMEDVGLGLYRYYIRMWGVMEGWGE